VESGKLADLIVVAANPLEDISNIGQAPSEWRGSLTEESAILTELFVVASALKYSGIAGPARPVFGPIRC
jgi:hypothetical protein